MTWPEAVDRFGVAIVVLVVFAGFVGATIWRVGRWLAPRIDKFLSRHYDLVENLEAATKSQTSSALQTAQSLTAIVGVADKQDARMANLESKVDDRNLAIQDNTKATEQLTASMRRSMTQTAAALEDLSRKMTKWGDPSAICQVKFVDHPSSSK